MKQTKNNTATILSVICLSLSLVVIALFGWDFLVPTTNISNTVLSVFYSPISGLKLLIDDNLFAIFAFVGIGLVAIIFALELAVKTRLRVLGIVGSVFSIVSAVMLGCTSIDSPSNFMMGPAAFIGITACVVITVLGILTFVVNAQQSELAKK